MNKLVTLILGIMVLTSCGLEKLNLKSDNFSYRKKVNGEWTNFTDWEPINVKVEIKKIPFSGFIRDDSGRVNINKCKFIIYDNPKISLRVVEKNEEIQEMDEEIVSFNCVDSHGEKCRLILLDRGESIYAIIYYDNLNLRYNIIEVK
jgi:hypothetical protein